MGMEFGFQNYSSSIAKAAIQNFGVIFFPNNVFGHNTHDIAKKSQYFFKHIFLFKLNVQFLFIVKRKTIS